MPERFSQFYGRRLTALRMLLTGLGSIALIEIYAAVMQREFQHTDNRVGKGFAILGIYAFVVAFCKWPLELVRQADQD